MYIEEYDFTISTDAVNYLETEDGIYHSYTFRVIRTINNGLKENLLFSLNEEGNYDSFLITYNLTTQEQIDFVNNNFVDIENKISISSIDGISLPDNFLSKKSIDCIDITFEYCSYNNPNHPSGRNPAGNKCPGYTTGEKEICDYIDDYYNQDNNDNGGGDAGTSTGDSGTTTNSNGTGEATGGGSQTEDPENDYDPTDSSIHGNNPVLTNPNFEEPIDNPCNNIKNGTNNAEYKQKFKDLNVSANFNLPDETGFYQKEVNGQNQYIDAVAGTNHMLKVGTGSLNATHVHNNKPKVKPDGTNYDGAVKVPSPVDLSLLLGIIQNANNPTPENGFVISVSDEGIYAITLLEPVSFTLEQDLLWNDFIDKYESIAANIIEDISNLSNRKKALEKMFLKELKKIGIDNKIGFFEGTVENETDPDINNYNIKWSRKKLKKVFLGYTLKNTPCN